MIEVASYVLHHALPFRRQERGERLLAQFVADFGTEDRHERRAKAFLVAGADVHQQRIDDSVARERIHFETALVGRKHLLSIHVDGLHSFVDPDDLLEQRDAEADAGLGRAEDPVRLAELHDDGLLRFRNDRKCRERE